jgi:hypothetical protein
MQEPIMQASKRNSLSVEAPASTRVQREPEWFIVVAELDDGLLTFENLKVSRRRHDVARSGGLAAIRGRRIVPAPESAVR